MKSVLHAHDNEGDTKTYKIYSLCFELKGSSNLLQYLNIEMFISNIIGHLPNPPNTYHTSYNNWNWLRQWVTHGS